MEEKLFKVADIIENHFTDKVWNGYDLDIINFKLLELGVRIYGLIKNLNNVENATLEISNLMTWMEQQFKIPLLNPMIDEWLKVDVRNKIVYEVYNALSDIRVF